jgi:hypothetical protein
MKINNTKCCLYTKCMQKTVENTLLIHASSSHWREKNGADNEGKGRL